MHSPVDDLESCFWVSFWAVSFNKDHIKAKSKIEIGIRDKLATGRRVEALHLLNGGSAYCPYVHQPDTTY